jgi:hypothetical protein
MAGLFSVNMTAGSMSNAGRGFCGAGSRILQEMRVSDFAWLWA